MNKYDIAIVGAGIIGAATAWQLQTKFPARKIVLLEKERAPALHQTGRNSGVVHAGVYYAPGSLKARFCRQGLRATRDFCCDHHVPFLQCGKLLVATDDLELQRMEALQRRCEQNQLRPQWVGGAQLHKLEPNIRGVGAIRIGDTGITDYRAITTTMLALFERAGGALRYRQQVKGLHESDSGVDVITYVQRFTAKQLINCAGLMADKLARLMGLAIDYRIIPFRGEYFQLPPRFNRAVRHLIYPVPDPAMPFLGVHLTRMIEGSVIVGPNAVLALAREGYRKTDINGSDLLDTLSFKGAWPMFWRYRRSGVRELKNSLFKKAYLKQVQKYCPHIQLQHLLPHPSGVRAQAVSERGELLHDFTFVESEHSLHVGNAPSPAATAAIPIADTIVDKIAEKF